MIVILNKYNKTFKLSVIQIGVVIGTILGLTTLMYEPSVSDDAYRIFQWMDAIRDNNEKQLLKIQPGIYNLWVQYIYLKLLGFIFKNDNWACVVTVFFDFILCFNVYEKASKKSNINIGIYMSGILIFMSTWDYFIAASNIRYILACSAYMLLTYRMFVEEKNKLLCMVGCILLCFFHSGMIINLVFTLLLLLNKKIINIITIVVIFLQRYLMEVAYFVVPKLPGIVYRLIRHKFYSIYYSYKDGRQIELARMAIKEPLLLSCILIVICFYVFYRNKYPYLKKYSIFIILVMSMGIGGIYDYNLFSRNLMETCMFFIPIYCVIKREKTIEEKPYRRYLLKASLAATDVICAVHLIYLLKIQYTHF
jgi:hypothetical protein